MSQWAPSPYCFVGKCPLEQSYKSLINLNTELCSFIANELV